MSLPKLLDPTCLNCGHNWSAHFVNDPDQRCSLRVGAEGQSSWCNCGGFRGGCAKCNHSMSEHVAPGFEICKHIAPATNLTCTCDGYEPSR